MGQKARAGLAVAAVLVAAGLGGAPAWAAITWEGTWSSTFGEIQMTASGSGTYPNCGTISGGLSDGGLTNKGTWQECSSNGKYEFHMSASGGSFTGSYTRGESDTCVFPPCNWDGSCIAGACTENKEAPAEPPPCGSTADAFAAAKTCDVGKLPFGSEWSVPAPKAGATVDISPKPMRADAVEVLNALRELIEEEEELRAITLSVASAMTTRDEEEQEDLNACLLFGDIALGDTRYIKTPRTALRAACLELIFKQRTNARAAAGGCKAVFVPAFPKGRKVTKRMRRRAVATMRERIAASCKEPRVGRLSFSIRARGKRATLPDVVGRRLRFNVARRAPKDAPRHRLGVRWRQR